MDKPNDKYPRTRFAAAAAASLLITLLILMWSGAGSSDSGPEEIGLSEAIEIIETRADEIEQVDLSEPGRMFTITLVGNDEPSYTTSFPISFTSKLTEILVDAGVTIDTEPTTPPSMWSSLLLSLLPIVIIVGALVFFMRSRGGVGKMSKERSGPVDVPDTRFADVAGLDETVDELREVVDFLRDSTRYVAAGAKTPKGYLLEGPPGTGKTLLARAVAGEAGVPFFAVSGADFVEVFVGVGSGRVREVFSKARKAGKAIIFIDEIDAVGRARSNGPGGATVEHENTLVSLLSEMDGFTESGVIVLAATNRSDVLDPALLRPGRFDRRITVPNPDRGGREKILRLHAATRHVADDVDFASFARRTVGMSGADLAQLVNEAALCAVREGTGTITHSHFESALYTSMLGRERRSATVTDRDREITAWHEAGHAVCALVQPDAHDPVTVTIVPRGVAGGVTWMDGSDDQYVSKRTANAQLAVMFGGRAAEELLLDGDYTTGAAGDLRSATDLAVRMVTQYGMSRAGFAVRNPDAYAHNDDTVTTVVSEILDGAHEQALNLLIEHKGLLAAVAERLLRDETVDVSTLRDLWTAAGGS